jgi:Sulfatase
MAKWINTGYDLLDARLTQASLSLVASTIAQEERMEKVRNLFLVLGAALCLVIGTRIVPASARQIDRTQLPIPDTQYKYPGKIPLDARDAKFPPIKLLRPPEGAPNVAVILLDDIGFGAPSTFGGGVNMPTLDALAREGLRYTQFHTAALCSPTREALPGTTIIRWGWDRLPNWQPALQETPVCGRTRGPRSPKSSS